MEQFRDKFKEEANDLINDLEKALLELESDFNNSDTTQKIFRIMHSLKGGSSMFGFNKMDKFTHHLENIYDLIRNNKLDVDDNILNLTFESVDHLRNLIQEEDDADNTNQAQHDLLLSKIKQITDKDSDESGKTIQNIDVSINKTESTYYISFEPNNEMFKFGTNPLYLIDELVDLGEVKIFPRFDKIPNYKDIDVTMCYVYWDIFLSTNQGINAISEVFIFADDQCNLNIHKISEINLLKESSFLGIIEKTVASQDKIDVNHLKSLMKDVESVFAKEKNIKLKSRGNNADTSISNIRVSAEKLDNLINWVSELVTIQARLSLHAQETESVELAPIVEEVEKISRRLRDDVFSIRLIPIETVLTRFYRLVRELSNELKKEVVFKTEGTETELDKNIIEILADPLMHIVRNSMDHGIESVEERKIKNKPASATIKLKAFYSGTNVVIQVSDDGKGIDPVKIREHAIAKGVINKDVELTDKESLELLFMPGFSTAEKITNVSGRGVGMDVVKRKISEIRGEVGIESVIDEGTIITIKLPLTLSIIDGLLVQIGDTKFVIPLSSVDKCFEFKQIVLDNSINNLIRTENDEIAYLDLRDLFKIKGAELETSHIVVVQFGDIKIGLAVDNIIGQYQAVLKPLGKLYKHQQSISGATILGDGTVALIMDTNQLISQFASNNETKVGG
jgi:two-component system chemotaxis sensor kinase CheA